MAKQSKQSNRIKTVLLQRKAYPETMLWLDQLLETLKEEPHLEADTLEWLEQELRGGYGWEYTKIDEEYEQHINFWQTLAQKYPQLPKLKGILADTLLLADRIDESMDTFSQAFEKDPLLVYEFGGELYDYMQKKGGEHWLQYRLTLVRAALESDDEQYAREVYRELLEEYEDNKAALQKIRALARKGL